MFCVIKPYFGLAEENSGDELLELGTGPNLIASTFASRRFKKIYLSDYSEANNESIRKWINKEEGAWNWGPFFEQVAKMENHPGYVELKLLLLPCITFA